MRKPRVLKPEETRLWHKIARSTKPISVEKMNSLDAEIKAIEASLPKDVPKTSIASVKPTHSNRLASRKNISSEIQDAAAHKKVRRGKIEIGATLDLHGFTQDDAKSRLQDFIYSAFENNLRCVLVITGKGSKSSNEKEKHFDFFSSPRGIIRARFKDWLHEPVLRHLISGVAIANPKHGGAGAFYVLLKARPID